MKKYFGILMAALFALVVWQAAPVMAEAAKSADAPCCAKAGDAQKSAACDKCACKDCKCSPKECKCDKQGCTKSCMEATKNCKDCPKAKEDCPPKDAKGAAAAPADRPCCNQAPGSIK